MAILFPRRAGIPIHSGQVTVYHAGDDGGLYRFGLTSRYEIIAPGTTTPIQHPHYAAPTISFTAPNIVADAAAGLVTVLTGDSIRIRGSALNNGVFTVAGGGVAAAFTTVEPIVNEIAGSYVSLCKREAHTNNVVYDLNTGLWWSQAVSSLVGNASNGLIPWYDPAFVYVLHPAAADLQIIAATNTLRIVGGAGQVARYNAGDIYSLAGFANAINNGLGYMATAVTVNGADLDITLFTFGATLINEAAAGARSISIICRNIFSYAAAARVAQVGGFDDWRIARRKDVDTLLLFEAPLTRLDPIAFPVMPPFTWLSTTIPFIVANAATLYLPAAAASLGYSQDPKGLAYPTILVRGGVPL